MSDVGEVFRGLIGNVITFGVMMFLAVVTFFATVFVIDQGASLAG